jgi:hypothetical protein
MSQHHDPVHPDSDHLTAEVLADLELGLLDAGSAAHAEQHLAHCADCSALRGDLASLSDALADLPDEPMPDAVWEQLAEAMAAEPVLTPAGSATVVPIEAARRRRWGRPGIGVVAGAAGVALIGAIIVSSDFGGGDTATTLSETADSAQEDRGADLPLAAYAATQSGTRYQEAALSSQVTELVAARATFTPTPPVGDFESATASPTASTSADPEGEGTAEPTQRPEDSVAPMATDPAAAQACLEGYLDVDGVQPLAIDIGVWQGEPAAVIVLPDVDPDLVEVWVIDPDCTGPDDPLFYFATVAR